MPRARSEFVRFLDIAHRLAPEIRGQFGDVHDGLAHSLQFAQCKFIGEKIEHRIKAADSTSQRRKRFGNYPRMVKRKTSR